MKLSSIVPLTLGGAAALQGFETRPAPAGTRSSNGVPLAARGPGKGASVPGRRQLVIPPGVSLPETDHCLHPVGAAGSLLLGGATLAAIGAGVGHMADKAVNRQVSYDGIFKLGGAAVGLVTAGIAEGFGVLPNVACDTDVQPSRYVSTNANDCVNGADVALIGLGSGAAAAGLTSAGFQYSRVDNTAAHFIVPLMTGSVTALTAALGTRLDKPLCRSDFTGVPEPAA